MEWIALRLERLREMLNRNAGAAAQALKELLGTIRLEPITDQEADPYHVMGEEGYTFKPYYVAHTKINTLALLDEHQGANWSRWWTRLQPIRTVGEITARIPIKPAQQIPLYQSIARRGAQPRHLGMSYKETGEALNVSPSLARKADKLAKRTGP
ncbi:MAG: hypothetical protein HY598_05510 [Candidatus Omnitrophica bacterium]|nr:hypothetical protein [Candidatus Omnitrophota bacterium]